MRNTFVKKVGSAKLLFFSIKKLYENLLKINSNISEVVENDEQSEYLNII